MTGELPAGLREVLRVARACASMRSPPVLVGGWLPYLLTENVDRQYLGTKDIDLALTWMLADSRLGSEFEQIMLGLGARPKTAEGSDERSAIWDLPAQASNGGLVTLDFIAAQPHSGPAQEIPVAGSRWVNAVAFIGAARALLDTTVTTLPDARGSNVDLHHLRVGGYVWSKAHALLGRAERRDDYALAHVLRWHRGGPEAVAAAMLDSPLGAVLKEGRDAWNNLRIRFTDQTSPGANSYAALDAQADLRPQTGAERRAASASVLRFLEKLGM